MVGGLVMMKWNRFVWSKKAQNVVADPFDRCCVASAAMWGELCDI
jgi:hypothetical protein